MKSQRIVSKLGDFDSYGADSRRVEKAGESFSGVKVDYDTKYKKSLETVKVNYASLDVPYYGLDNNDYVNGLGFCCNPSGGTASGGSSTGKMTAKNDNAELQQFYYHPDHLGSSSYISNLDGEVVQHVEYVPFGEVFLEEKNAKWNTPYLFTSKELDRETGIYYFGARYQDPKLGIFISVDPLALKYPGVSSYAYALNNPVRFVDPSGMSSEDGIDPPTAKEIYQKALSYLPKEQRKQIEKIVNTIQKKVGEIDYSKLAIGIENTAGIESSAGVKTEANAISGNVIFLGGVDAGYVYSYHGGDVGIGGETSLSAGVNIAVSYFVAYNHSGKGGHINFDGNYDFKRGGLGIDTGLITNIVGVNAGAGMSINYGRGDDWELYSIGSSIGVSAGFSTSITGSYTQGSGNVKFSNRENVGKPKSFSETVTSYWKILSPFN